jgi:hypothetical protein
MQPAEESSPEPGKSMQRLEMLDDQYGQYEKHEKYFPGASFGNGQIGQRAGSAENYRPGIDFNEEKAQDHAGHKRQ